MKNVYIFGDSTTQEYEEKYYPQQGWAYYLKGRFDEDISLINVANAGFSLKTFIYSEDYKNGSISENEPNKSRWTEILNMTEAGDYMIFYWAGINDMLQICLDSYRECEKGDYVRDWQNTAQESYIYIGKGLGTHSFFTLRSDVDEYIDIFRGLISDVRERGVIPIVVRGTGKYYKIGENDKNVVSVCRRYSEAVEDIAKSCNAEYIDVGTEFEKGFYEIGYEKMLEKYFISLKAYENYSKERKISRKMPTVDDNVHYSLAGAEHVAEIFLNQLKKSECGLKNYLK